MKKYIFILMAVVLGTVACNERAEITEKNNVPFDPSTIAVEEGGPKIKIKGKPYRAVEVRERDLKKCECKFCFGICDVGIEIELDLKDFGLVADLPNNKADIYVLENLPNAETEFGIDLDLNIPSSYLQGSGLNQLTLLQGLYTYTPQIDTIIIDNISYVSYGKVNVDISHN